MRYMTHEHGVEDGRQAVDSNAEFDWTLADYKKNLTQELLEYKQGANAAEKSEYSAGYMRCVEDALEEMACQGMLPAAEVDEEV